MQTPITFKALQIGKSWFPEQAGSGLDRVYYAMMRHLPNVGVGVSGVVAGSEDVYRTSNGAVRAFAPVNASLSSRFQSARRVITDALADEVDLIASHFALYTFPVVDRLREKPFVIHFHGPWADESKVEKGQIFSVKAKRQIERLVYQRGARFIVLSEPFGRLLCSNYGIAEEDVRIVPGAVDAAKFDTGLTRDEARGRLGWPADRPILLAVRRLAHRMGLENLITSFQEVIRSVPDALLYIAGQGPIRDELQTRIDDLGLSAQAKLLGFVPDSELPLAYRAANLSVVPTVALEGFGLITVESLAAGTPVMVTPVGGLPEVVRGLSGELIFQSSDPSDLAGQIKPALLGDIELPSAEACQAYVRTRFDWPVVVQQVRRVYEEVLN